METKQIGNMKDIDKKVKEVEGIFRSGDLDGCMGYIRGDFETFEGMMIDTLDLGDYYEVDSEDFSEDEVDDNIEKLKSVLFEECVNRLRIELRINT